MLQFALPAKCNNDYTVYNISGITLGEDVEIPVNVIGYNNKSSGATRFFIEYTKNCKEFDIISGPLF